MTNEAILEKVSNRRIFDFLYTPLTKDTFFVSDILKAMAAARQDEREKLESQIKQLEERVINLQMADMTHEYNQAEALRFAPEYERQIREDEREKMAGEAVAFMEWAAGEGWQTYDGPDRWICPQENRVVVTTNGLYQLFLKSKQ